MLLTSKPNCISHPQNNYREKLSLRSPFSFVSSLLVLGVDLCSSGGRYVYGSVLVYSLIPLFPNLIPQITLIFLSQATHACIHLILPYFETHILHILGGYSPQFFFFHIVTVTFWIFLSFVFVNFFLMFVSYGLVNLRIISE